VAAAAPPGPEQIGLEIEWLVLDPSQPPHRLPPAEIEAAIAAGGPLPAGGRITVEPGGQIELDTPPVTTIEGAIRSAVADSAEVRRRLHRIGAATVPLAMDPWRNPRRVLDAPRYRSMQQAFDRAGPAGRTMMCNTAAFQVNLDLGRDGGSSRWQLLDAVGPALAAAFANSPVSGGAPNGWKSARLATWAAIDPSRTRAVCSLDDPAAAWLAYALDADVLFVRAGEDHHVQVRPGFSFGTWLAEGHPEGWPTEDDWATHLTTLFPPVRPRGWFEVRHLDALSDAHWPVAAAVLWALVGDDEAGEAARVATTATQGRWDEAARHGAAHPELGAAAGACLDAAAAGLARLGCGTALVDEVHGYSERYPRAGRCPADDVLEACALGLLDPGLAAVPAR
jgi:glutamate--cysteine ligase